MKALAHIPSSLPSMKTEIYYKFNGKLINSIGWKYNNLIFICERNDKIKIENWSLKTFSCADFHWIERSKIHLDHCQCRISLSHWKVQYSTPKIIMILNDFYRIWYRSVLFFNFVADFRFEYYFIIFSLLRHSSHSIYHLLSMQTLFLF